MKCIKAILLSCIIISLLMAFLSCALLLSIDTEEVDVDNWDTVNPEEQSTYDFYVMLSLIGLLGFIASSFAWLVSDYTESDYTHDSTDRESEKIKTLNEIRGFKEELE